MSNFTNSPLASYARISGHSAPRKHVIDTITIHCYVGQVTAQQGCDYFATTDEDASVTLYGCVGSQATSIVTALSSLLELLLQNDRLDSGTHNPMLPSCPTT